MIHLNRSRNLESFGDVGARSLLSSNNLHKTMDKIFQIWTENRMFFYLIFFNVMINLKKKQHSIQVALIVKIVLMCEYLFFLENCMKDSKIFIFFWVKISKVNLMHFIFSYQIRLIFFRRGGGKTLCLCSLWKYGVNFLLIRFLYALFLSCSSKIITSYT